MDDIFNYLTDLFDDVPVPEVKITVDHDLDKEEFENVKELILSTPGITGVDFKGTVSVNFIEQIKCLLEISPLVDDKSVEKIVLVNFNRKELEKLLNLNYVNPETWSIAYKYEDNSFKVALLPEVRKIEEYISLISSSLKKNLTPLELIKELYDFVKLLEPKEEASNLLQDIINTRTASSYGFSYLLQELLARFNIPSYIIDVSRDKKLFHSLLVEINDDKYLASGMYLFDPESDAVPKHSYRNDLARHVNYNFFALSCEEVQRLVYGDKFAGIMGALMISDEEFGFRKYRRRKNIREVTKIENTFDTNYLGLKEKINTTKNIPQDMKVKLFTSNVKKELIKLNKNIDVKHIIKENYLVKRQEMFIEEKKEIEPVDIYDI